MNWAKERAEEIVSGISDVVGNGILHKEAVAAIAAALQRVADECAKVALEEMAKFYALRKTVPDDQVAGILSLLDKADGAVAACASIRIRFPKEEA